MAEELDKLWVEQRFFAAIGNVWAGAVVVLDPPLNGAQGTNPGRQIQKNDGIGRFQTHFQRAAVIAVDDPFFTLHQLGDGALPFVMGRANPARMPVMAVQMDNG